MSIIDKIKERAKKYKVKIVLPEYMDSRVMKAISIALREDICDIIIVGNSDDFSYVDDIILQKAEIIDPINNDLTDKLVNYLFELRKNKGLSYDDAKKLIYSDYIYFACLLVKMGYADGVVSGACHSSADTIRPALQIIKTNSDTKLVSSFFLMETINSSYGSDGIFLFADAGLNQSPDALALSYIARDTANSFSKLIKKNPKVAMLSHSTKGSANHPDVLKVREATELAVKNFPNLVIDGELQLDAAIVPEVAKIKCPDSVLKGRANVLIFPNLDSANIGYKLVERLGNANAYGPICQGLNNPVNDLSRGASVNDIVGVIAITALQAQEKIEIL